MVVHVWICARTWDAGYTHIHETHETDIDHPLPLCVFLSHTHKLTHTQTQTHTNSDTHTPRPSCVCLHIRAQNLSETGRPCTLKLPVLPRGGVGGRSVLIS